MEITLRKARSSDSEIILAWRNEPSTIPWMGNKRALSSDEHQAWFTKMLDDPDCLFFIIEISGNPVGQLRYHRNDTSFENTARVSLNLTEKMHGKGIATRAFKKGSELVKELDFAKIIVGYPLPTNLASIKALEKAGYVREKMVAMHNTTHLIMLHHLSGDNNASVE